MWATHFNVLLQPFAEQFSHLPPRHPDGPRQRHRLHHLPRHAVEDPELIGVLSRVTRVILSDTESGVQGSGEEVIEHGERPVDAHGPFSRSECRAALGFEDGDGDSILLRGVSGWRVSKSELPRLLQSVGQDETGAACRSSQSIMRDV